MATEVRREASWCDWVLQSDGEENKAEIWTEIQKPDTVEAGVCGGGTFGILAEAGRWYLSPSLRRRLSGFYCPWINLRQKQMALKKRQWHKAWGSQQPNWGTQLCVSWEQLETGESSSTLTVGDGRGTFGGTGPPLGFWRAKEKEELLMVWPESLCS